MPVAVVALFLTLAACTHHRSLAELEVSTGDDVTVETHDGQGVDSVVQRVPAGAVFTTADGGAIDPSAIARVVEVRRVRGALEGMGIGALVGAGTGAILGFADGDDTCENEGHCWFAMTAESKAVIGGMVLGVLGGGIGVIVGAIRGSSFVYSAQAQPRIMPGGPPGSVGGVTISF